MSPPRRLAGYLPPFPPQKTRLAELSWPLVKCVAAEAHMLPQLQWRPSRGRSLQFYLLRVVVVVVPVQILRRIPAHPTRGRGNLRGKAAGGGFIQGSRVQADINPSLK